MSARYSSDATGGRKRLPYKRSIGTCRDCSERQPIVGRGMCRRCYSRDYRMAHPSVDRRWRQGKGVW